MDHIENQNSDSVRFAMSDSLLREPADEADFADIEALLEDLGSKPTHKLGRLYEKILGVFLKGRSLGIIADAIRDRGYAVSRHDLVSLVSQGLETDVRSEKVLRALARGDRPASRKKATKAVEAAPSPAPAPAPAPANSPAAPTPAHVVAAPAPAPTPRPAFRQTESRFGSSTGGTVIVKKEGT